MIARPRRDACLKAYSEVVSTLRPKNLTQHYISPTMIWLAAYRQAIEDAAKAIELVPPPGGEAILQESYPWLWASTYVTKINAAAIRALAPEVEDE